ncbi:hypothetical protein D3C78_1747850 [compost metagenome]
MTLFEEFGDLEGGGHGLAVVQGDQIGRGKAGDTVHDAFLWVNKVNVTKEVRISDW